MHMNAIEPEWCVIIMTFCNNNAVDVLRSVNTLFPPVSSIMSQRAQRDSFMHIVEAEKRL